MNATNGAVAARAASASEKLRPMPGAKLKFLPVPVRDVPDWNSRVANWACA